ncbi:MAG TPA: YbaK/EbsC family protein [Thermoanaerobaculia bacterium]|nr:YbaK/EbsC family protein [Thermoanaerobaculia bacterium]
MLDPQVAAALDTHGITYEPLACEPHLADTAEFCAHYGIEPEEACNAIVVALKTEPRQYVACLVRSDTRLDVNHKVSAAVSFKRLSFASAEETAQLTGMLIGGVTLVGLPPELPILIDERVMERPTVIIGGGNRSSKIRLAPAELLKLPNTRVADIAK